MRDLCGLAVDLYRREREVGVVYHREDLMRGVEHSRALRENGFCFLREDVGLPIDDELQRIVVVLKLRVGGESLERLGRESCELRVNERDSAGELHLEVVDTGEEGGVGGVAGVLVVLHVGVDAEPA